MLSGIAHGASSFTGPITSGAGSFCLDVAGQQVEAKGNVRVAFCDKAASQTWTVAGETTTKTIAVGNGLCCDVDGTYIVSGANVILNPCVVGKASQQWLQRGQLCGRMYASTDPHTDAPALSLTQATSL